MKQEKVLTVLWFGAFLLAMLIMESYFWRRVSVAGQLAPIVSGGDRMPYLREILAIYAAPLTAVAAFWFGKPFPKTKSRANARFRYLAALTAVVTFNLVALGLLAMYHFRMEGQLDEAFVRARQTALMLDILIVPVTAYYFGSKRMSE